jgi:hypothetical protein
MFCTGPEGKTKNKMKRGETSNKSSVWATKYWDSRRLQNGRNYSWDSILVQGHNIYLHRFLYEDTLSIYVIGMLWLDVQNITKVKT